MGLTSEQQKLVEENHNLIYHILRQMHLDIDDWYGVGAIGLCEAGKRYKPDMGCKFSSFAGICIKSAINREYRMQGYQKRAMDKELVYYDAEISDNDIDTYQNYLTDDVDVEQSVIDKITKDNMADSLDEKKKKIFTMLMDGYVAREIGEVMGCTDKNIHQQKKTIEKKLKAMC